MWLSSPYPLLLIARPSIFVCFLIFDNIINHHCLSHLGLSNHPSHSIIIPHRLAIYGNSFSNFIYGCWSY